MERKRHIGTKLRRKLMQLFRSQAELPELTARDESGGCISRASAHAASDWHPFGHLDERTGKLLTACSFCGEPSRTVHERIDVREPAGINRSDKAHLKLVGVLNVHVLAQIDCLKHGSQRMVSIVASVADRKAEIDFPGSPHPKTEGTAHASSLDRAHTPARATKSSMASDSPRASGEIPTDSSAREARVLSPKSPAND